ncbi:hypothetical protein HPB49_018044 [Dermacentor silvarum]|uniref:Uncharacterized protein n=1 Tax=Dermacentor silvarum TaxID=543639 RepID=A0ACB8CZD4_DERSI|nr:hypothetical protein HPB49_018044 [Dermacentor silvarum]
MRLTLNIERSEYLDIISPEFGARILIHPLGTLPSLERGGITLTPGSKSYISIRMRKIERLPEPYRGCSKSFNDSRITPYLREVGLDDLLQRSIYTFDFCQTLCREAALLRTCGCLDELSTSGRASCDLCNVTQARCRTRYLRSYTSSSGGLQCKALCLPECVEVRYDLTTSQSEWPNFRQQAWAIKRWPLLNKRMQEAGIRWQEVLNATDDRIFRDELLALRWCYASCKTPESDVYCLIPPKGSHLQTSFNMAYQRNMMDAPEPTLATQPTYPADKASHRCAPDNTAPAQRKSTRQRRLPGGCQAHNQGYETAVSTRPPSFDRTSRRRRTLSPSAAPERHRTRRAGGGTQRTTGDNFGPRCAQVPLQ